MSSELILAAGIAVSVAAYFAKNFVLEPILRYRAVKGRIQNRLKYHANVLANSGLADEAVSEARRTMRQLSCDLEEAYSAIGMRRWLTRMRLLPSMKVISDAGSSLIFLSNAPNSERFEERTVDAMDDVRRMLGLLK